MSNSTRVAIVTGGMTGIGLATVQALLSDGVCVAVGARRADDPAMSKQFHATVGTDVFLAPLDVQSTQSIADFISAT
ncbi:MAG: SDR family NAD(P)-dependent oxidoreductase, partial [Methyloligellaceae bacterium]